MPESEAPGRVLVFGGSGFLGAQLLAALDSPDSPDSPDGGGRELLSVSRNPGARPRAPRETIRDVAGDLAQGGVAETLIQLLQPSTVFLVAALARVGDCERDPDLAQRLNVELPREVAKACSVRGLRLLFTSTDLVFAGEPPRETGYREEDPADATGVYGESKAEGERALLAAHPEALVVRLPLLFGNSVQRGLGASDSLIAALDKDESPKLFTDEFRSPLDVDNASRALVELSRTRESGRLHVAGPDRLSRLELGRLVVAASPRPSDGERLEAVTRADLGLADRPRDVSLDSSRARQILREPLLSVRKALEKPRQT